MVINMPTQDDVLKLCKWTTTTQQTNTYVYEHQNYKKLKKKKCPHCGKIMDGYENPYNEQRFEFEQPCLAEQCAEQIRRERGLPSGTPVPVHISCPCPRCSPRC